MDLSLNGSLVTACKHNNINYIKTLIKQGADVHYEGNKTLVTAISNRQLEVVEFLLDCKVDPYANDDLAIRTAIKNHPQILHTLILKGVKAHIYEDEVFNTLAPYLAYNPYWHHLFDLGLDPTSYLEKNNNKYCPLGYTFSAYKEKKKLTFSKFLKNILSKLSNTEHTTSFLKACYHGDLISVKKFISLGVNIHTQKDKAFRHAIRSENLDIVQLLHEQGVNIAKNSETALDCAIINKKPDIFKYLVEHGANPTVKNNKFLLKACASSNFDLVRYIIEDYGCDVDIAINSITTNPYFFGKHTDSLNKIYEWCCNYKTYKSLSDKLPEKTENILPIKKHKI